MEQKQERNRKETLVAIRWGRFRLIVFVLFWLLMAYLLWEREIRIDFLDGPGSMPTNQFFFEALSYSQGGQSVGFSCNLIHGAKNGKIRIEHRGSLALSSLPVQGPVNYSGDILLTGEYELEQFHYVIEFSEGRFTTIGIRKDQVLQVRYGIGELMQEMSFPVPEQGIQLSMLSIPLLAQKITFESGRNYRIRQYNLFSNQFEDVEIQFGMRKESVLGEKLVEVYPMKVKIGTMESELLVTSDGRTLKEKTFLGVSAIQLTAKELLFNLARTKENMNVLPIIPIVEEYVKIEDKELTLDITGASMKEFELGAPGRQKWDEKNGRLTVESPAGLEDATMEGHITPLDEELAMSIPVPIQQAAERILGTVDVIGEPERAVEKLLRWVETNLQDTLTTESMDMMEVLRTRRAGPEEKNRMFVALARAARLPVVLVTGLAYEEGGFFLKRWARIHLQEKKDIEIYPANISVRVDETWIQLWEEEPPEPLMVWMLTNLELEQVAPVNSNEEQE